MEPKREMLPRGRNARRMQPTAEPDAVQPRPAEDSPTALLPLYLREMGETPLLDKDQEVELSRELQEARRALAKLALRLPANCRRYALQGDTKGPRRGRNWPLDRLETFYDRLLKYEREHDEPRVSAMVKEARGHRHRLDRARDALILANLRLVAHIAKKYLNHGLSFMDLIQEGNIGLMKAVEKFEYQRGYRFSTYAYWWIKQAVARAIADKGRTIRVPVHVGEKLKKIMRVAVELGETLGRKPKPLEIARKLKMPVTKVEEILSVVQDAQSFDDLGSRDEKLSLLQFVADPNATSPYETAVDQELKRKIEASLQVLDAREEEIIRMRFGIGRETPHTLEDIGRAINLSRERVRQIEDAALKKIQAAGESKDLAEHFSSQ